VPKRLLQRGNAPPLCYTPPMEVRVLCRGADRLVHQVRNGRKSSRWLLFLTEIQPTRTNRGNGKGNRSVKGTSDGEKGPHAGGCE